MKKENTTSTDRNKGSGSPDPHESSPQFPDGYDPDDMRQGKIVLRSKRQRAAVLGVVCAGTLLFIAIAAMTAT